MNVNDAVRELRRKEKELRKAFSRTLPRRIGAKAVNLVTVSYTHLTLPTSDLV